MAEEKRVQYDIDGYDVLTTSLLELLNQFPGLDDGEKIAFSVLDEESGIGMLPISGAVIETEKEGITGHVRQVCLYPFYIVYRASGLSESRKANVKEWLDNLGKWLEKQPITMNDQKYVLSEYPTLSGNREFLSISRQTPGYLDGTNENKSEDWVIHISARYKNEYDK